MTEFMKDFMGIGDTKDDYLSVGDILKVIRGDGEQRFAVWLATGDFVRVIEIYPHIVRVERIRPFDNPAANGKHLTQSYPRRSWRMNLRRVRA